MKKKNCTALKQYYYSLPLNFPLPWHQFIFRDYVLILYIIHLSILNICVLYTQFIKCKFSFVFILNFLFFLKPNFDVTLLHYNIFICSFHCSLVYENICKFLFYYFPHIIKNFFV